MTYTISTKINHKDWNYIIRHLSDATIFHTLEYLLSYKDIGVRLVYLCLYKDNIPTALIIGRYWKKRFGFSEYLYIGSKQSGFPIFVDGVKNKKVILQTMLDFLEKNILNNIKLGEVYFYACDTKEDKVFLENNYKKIKLNNLYIDLSIRGEGLWRNLEPRCRRAIKKAAKNNIKIKKDNSLSTKVISRLLSETEKNKNIKLFSKSLINQINILKKKGMCDIWTANYLNQPIAIVIIYSYNKKIHFAYGGSSLKGRELRANNLLHWEIIKFYSKKGFREYHLGGTAPSTDEVSGYGKFKLSFNPIVTDCNRHIKINSIFIHMLYKYIGPIYRKVLRK